MYRAQIDEYFAAHAAEMTEDICSLVRIRSDRQATQPGLPYGAGPAQALAAALEMAASLGFATRNYDNHVGTVDLNGRPAQLDILAHLDVVPAGDDWTVTQPFEPLVRDGRIYGRGAADDKGPAVAALYALRAVKDLGIPLSGNVRLILGTDEECGAADLKYYYQHEPEAPLSFSPDAEFPVINIEKGGLRGDFSAVWPETADLPRLLSIQAGVKFNVVPDQATAVIEGLAAGQAVAACVAIGEKTDLTFSLQEDGGTLVISARGIAAHAATPAAGNNAITGLLELLASLPLHPGPALTQISGLQRLFPHGDWSGRALGVAMHDDLSGELTLSLNMIEGGTKGLKGLFDCRSPLCATDATLRDAARARLQAAGFELASQGAYPPHHVPEDQPFVKTLLRCYEQYSGKPGQCLAIGGGTYVHNLKNGVAFGCADLAVDNHLHGADEFAEIDQLILSARIFTQVIIELCG